MLKNRILLNKQINNGLGVKYIFWGGKKTTTTFLFHISTMYYCDDLTILIRNL